jgi:hypothetical protein
MSYKLKPKELAFQVTREGKFEYRRYKHGETYNEIPPEDAHRFEEITNKTNDTNKKPELRERKPERKPD